MAEPLMTVEGMPGDSAAPAQSPEKKPSLLQLIGRGIWSENPGLCQVLGLCPLLAVTSTAANALGLAIATLVVLCLSSVIISALRLIIYREVRIPIYVVLIATLVTVIKFYVEAFYPALYDQLGIYLALIVTNCIIMGRAEAFSGKHGPVRAFCDALGCGLGFALVLFALGSVREILGSGTWFMHGHELLGDWALSLETTVLAADHTLLIAILPPGGFFVLALFIALKNAISGHRRLVRENRFKIKSIRD